MKNTLTKAQNAAYMREYRAKRKNDPEWVAKQREFDKKYRDRAKTDKEYYLSRKLIALRASAKRRNLEFSLTVDDIIIPEKCPILGITLDQTGEDVNARISVDRMNNELGYVPGNICVISNKANTCKRDLTIEQLESLLAYVRNGHATQGHYTTTDGPGESIWV